jgi:hypothetical protein
MLSTHVTTIRLPGSSTGIRPARNACPTVVATRNLADLRKTGIQVINPWQTGS